MFKELARKYLRRYGNDFKTMREISKLSQIEVAKRLKCSQAIISHIETGQMLPSKKFEQELISLYNSII